MKGTEAIAIMMDHASMPCRSMPLGNKGLFLSRAPEVEACR